MQQLNRLLCESVHGGNQVTATTHSDNSNWQCECYCYDTAQRKFVDENDDTWLWWFITRPYYAVKGVVTSFL